MQRAPADLSPKERHALDQAINGLEREHPELSARTVITRTQMAGLAGFVLAAIGLIALAPQTGDRILAALLGITFLGNMVFRLLLVWTGGHDVHPAPAPAVEAAALPFYSLIVPLYREADVMPALAEALGALDYPSERLEILLAVEADDEATASAAAALARSDNRFRAIAVPPSAPRTKPKAANFALQFAHGTLVVIYDAEDRPEPDQLRKAAAVFAAAPPDLACLQARLSFYNANENWLTRMFTLDYALWFGLLLPGLDRLRMPMPLGGTSNHFRIEALHAIGAWDPYNVTEDADLGLRFARIGSRVVTLDSTTYEEATVELGNWLRQRSRWMKGYMQTWLVHMRNPLRLWRDFGAKGFVALQLFIAGTFLTALINPLLLLWFVAGQCGFLGESGCLFSGSALMAGYALAAWLAMLGSYQRGLVELAPFGLASPFYWLLISAASYRALWQLIVCPFHWDKTRHGVSQMSGQGPCASPL